MVNPTIFRRRYTASSAPPGTLAPTEGALPPRLHAISYNGESMEEWTPEPDADLRSLQREGRRLWIDVQGLGDGTLVERLGRQFAMHPLVVADIVNVGQRPKVEDYGSQQFSVVRMVVLEDEAVRWEQVSVVMMRDLVLTFQERYGDCLDPLRERLRRGRKLVRESGSDYLAAMVVDGVVDGYFPVLEWYGESLESLETDVIEDPSRAVLARIYSMKRELMSMRRAVWPLRDALSSQLRDRSALIADDTVPYIRDTSDHVMQIVDVTETYRELAGSFVDVYLSSVGHRTNEVMRVLTVIGSIFIPLTFIAGIYGMNFDEIPELHWRFGYPAFWVVSVMVTALMLLLFRRLGWLGRGKKG